MSSLVLSPAPHLTNDRPLAVPIDTSEASFAQIQHVDELEMLAPEWLLLFRSSGTRNPFAHPAWNVAWARHFVAPGQLSVITMRDESGALIGIAPLYRFRRRLGPGLSVTQLRLIGTGQSANLTELPQILAAPGHARQVLRDLMTFLQTHDTDWDWMELSLTPDQGWFEPQWIPEEAAHAGSFALHVGTKAAVVLPLPGSWDELRTGLKRNVKESIRRGANRLNREGLSRRIITPTDDTSLAATLDTLLTLHRERAGLQSKVRHTDQFSGRKRSTAFIHEVVHTMSASGHLTPLILEVGGMPVAGRLLLHANETTFLGLSGFDPAWWHYNVATTMMVECIQRAISRGDTQVNLSVGPDVSKLRWSEQLDVHHEWVVVNSPRRSRLAFSLYWQFHAAASLAGARARYALQAPRAE